MRYLVFLPEALVVAAAALVLLLPRLGWMPRALRLSPAPAVAGVLVVAFGVELWAGATLGLYFGGGFVQDRFALFAKAAVLLAAAVAVATTDWTAEDSPAVAVAMPLLGAFGVMVAASASDLVGLWAGLELAGAAGIVAISLRRPDLGLGLIVAGGVASGLFLIGLAYVYATVGSADLSSMRPFLLYTPPTVPFVLPVVILLGGLAVRAGLAPFHMARFTAVGGGGSPLGSGLVLGVAALGVGVVAIKLAAALIPVPDSYGPFLSVLGAGTIVGGGAAALAARSPRARIAYLATGQVGWVAAGLASHYRAGLAASLFLLGAFAIAATSAPALLGRWEGGDAGLAGLGVLRPYRAAGLALAMLSLAGAPPLAGFFGEMAVAASLAQGGQWVLLALGVAGSLLSLVAAAGTLRVLYVQAPLDEARRGAAGALPGITRFSSLGALAFCLVIAGYGFLANPIMGLADQGAEALGVR